MKIIVSLTSYPARIKNLYRVIRTLLIQNRKADKIILWLADGQFPEKERDLPSELLNLVEYGLEIRWCEDLKPHKKYFYVMQEFSDDIIITVDDDVYYTPRLIELLYNSYLKFPNAVSCMRANRIIMHPNGSVDYKEWEPNYRECVDEPVMDLLPVGVGGILYPPHSIPKEAFDESAVRELCLFQDDLWLKAMEVKNNVPTVLVGEKEIAIDFMEEEQLVGLSSTINVDGNNCALKKIMSFLDENTNETNYLYKRITQREYSVERIVERAEINRIKTEKEIVSMMTDKKLLVYGAGMGANMVFECLQSYSQILIPDAFIVKDKTKNPPKLHGIPVINLNDVDEKRDDYFVIVSTAEKLHEEINDYLLKSGFHNIVFIQDSVMGKIIRGKKAITDAHRDFLSSLKYRDD